MTRIKIADIPEDKKISREELRTIMGGGISPSGMFEVGQISILDPQIRGAGGATGIGASTQRVPSQPDPSKLMK